MGSYYIVNILVPFPSYGVQNKFKKEMKALSRQQVKEKLSESTTSVGHFVGVATGRRLSSWDCAFCGGK